MIISVLAYVSVALAAAPASLLQAYPVEIKRNEIVTFRPEKAHHFSLEAPQNCGGGALVEKNARTVRCQFTQSGEAQATLNVCDDKKTFCKPIAVKLKVSEQASAQTQTLIKNEKLNSELKHKLVPGFEMGSPAEMTAKAASQGKPVFAMISTDWCPPCNEAKEHLLSSKAFETVSAGWFKIYIDGDSVQAAEWEKKIPYKYYPSFVMLNPKMEQVARYTGPLRQSDFEAWAKETLALNGDAAADLEKRVLARRDGSILQKVNDFMRGVDAKKAEQEETRLIKFGLDSENNELVGKLAAEAKLPGLEQDLTRWKIARLQDEVDKGGEDKKDLRIELYQRLLNQLISRDGWAAAWSEFCEYDSKACSPQNLHVQERLQKLSERTGLTDAEKASMMGEEYMILADVYSNLGKKEEEKQMATKCVEAYEQLGKTSVLKQSRSARQGMVTCLDIKGDFKQAEALLKPLIEAYPSEPTFLSRMARIQRKAGKLPAALEWVNKAESVAYGYNWVTTRMLKSDILVEMKRLPEAKSVLSETLDQLALDGSQDSRNQRAVGRLRAAQTKVEAGLKR